MKKPAIVDAQKPIIIAIVGASGSGKTTLARHLTDITGIPSLVSYTTRPMRAGEVNGVDHHFVDDSYPIPRNPLAYTFFGGCHYWTEREQISAPVMSYVIDEKGLVELKDKWGDELEVFAIKIERPDNPTDIERQARDKERVVLPDDDYNCILHNTSTLHSFLWRAIYEIGQLLISKNK